MAMNAAEKARIAGRKQAVKAGTAKGQSAKESRKRYYVQTRVAELEKAGKPVSAEKRKQLREKFNSGNVSRKGFAAPKKKVSSSSSSSSSSPLMSAPSSSSSKGRSATSNMKGASGYKAGISKSSSKVSKVESKSSGVSGAFSKAKDFLDNELMGKDDSKRAADYILKGDYKKGAKSVGAAALEIGSLTGVGGLVTGFGGKIFGKAGVKGASNLKYYKNLGKSVPKIVGKGSLSKSAKAANFNTYKNLGKPAVKTATKTGAKTAVKTAKKAAPAVAKRSPRAAKTVAKPMVKSTSKPLTSKAVVRKSVAKKPVKKKPRDFRLDSM